MEKFNLQIGDYVKYLHEVSEIIAETDTVFVLKNKDTINKKTQKVRTKLKKTTGYVVKKTVYKNIATPILEVYKPQEYQAMEKRRILANEVNKKMHMVSEKTRNAPFDLLTKLNEVLTEIESL